MCPSCLPHTAVELSETVCMKVASTHHEALLIRMGR